jgi:hypothetical protein
VLSSGIGRCGTFFQLRHARRELLQFVEFALSAIQGVNDVGKAFVVFLLVVAPE